MMKNIPPTQQHDDLKFQLLYSLSAVGFKEGDKEELEKTLKVLNAPK